MALQKHREEDGRRFSCEQECTRSLREGDFDTCLDRTQEQVATLPIDNKDGMDFGRSARLPSGRQPCRSEGQMCPSRGGNRPVLTGLWKLDAGAGIPARGAGTVFSLCGAEGARVARTGDNEANRREVPRGHGVAVEGPRQLHREQEEAVPGSERTRLGRRPAESGAAQEPPAESKAEAKAEVGKGEQPDRGCRSRRMRDVDMRSGNQPGKIRVPGEAASTMHAGIWDLAFSALLRARTGISKFLHSVLAYRSFAEKQPEWQVWPMPLPFPEVHLRAKSRRLEDSQRKLWDQLCGDRAELAVRW